MDWKHTCGVSWVELTDDKLDGGFAFMGERWKTSQIDLDGYDQCLSERNKPWESCNTRTLILAPLSIQFGIFIAIAIQVFHKYF